MKQLLVTAALLLTACQWDDAERHARCRAGELTSCPPSTDDGGSADASVSADAGSPDAGHDGGSDAGRAVDGGLLVPGAAPLALFEGPRGALWVVTRDGAGGHVFLLERGALTPVDHPASLLTVAANPEIAPEQLLVATATGAYALWADGGHVDLPLAARPPTVLASIYASPANEPMASLWATSGGQHDQVVVALDGGAPPSNALTATCAALALHDVEVLPRALGGAGVVAWSASGCPPAAFLGEGAGVQTITPGGAREGDVLEPSAPTVRVGPGERGFEVLLQLGTTRARWLGYVPDGGSFTSERDALVIASEALHIGDVARGYASVEATGQLVSGGLTWPDGGRRVLVVRPAVALAPTEVGMSTVPQERLPLVVSADGGLAVLWLSSAQQVTLSLLAQ